MKAHRDGLTPDLFELPAPAITSPGGLDCRTEIAHAMSEALKGMDRYEVAATMGRLLGREKFSKAMLDAYTAESRKTHTPPLDVAIAFDLATASNTLVNLSASKEGARVFVGQEAMDARLGRLERVRDETVREIKRIKRRMGERDE